MRTLLPALLLTLSACIPKAQPAAAPPPVGVGAAPTTTASGPVPDELPAAAPVGDTNPFAGAKLYVDPASQAAGHARQATGGDAALLKLIADQPQADWLGEWSGNIEAATRGLVRAANAAGAVRVMVAYNVPNRDCGAYSKGGAKDPSIYRRWITDLAGGIGDGRAVVILEPDALGLLTKCLSPADQQARLGMLRFAVRTLRQHPNAAVYLDVGHPNWLSVDDAVTRLEAAGIREAHGFSLNTSNFVATDKNIAYGKQISERLGGKVGFVIDTSRNGKGEAPGQAWCNPPGRGLGHAPTTQTGDPLVHAFLWTKRPGESDGTCNDGPAAGQWFQAQALELARNAQLQ